MARIKYGQIGVGHAHASKISVYRDSADYEIVGVVEPNAELRAKAARQEAFRDVRFISEEELLGTPGLKVVGVETEVRDLLSAAERCVAAGMHVHLDKPAGANLPQYKRLLDAAAAKHLAVQMGYMFRYSPAVVMLRDFLKRGWLGEPFEVHTVMSKVVDSPSRKRLEEFSGGIMFELGCHVIDIVHQALGAPQQVTAFSQHASADKDGLVDNMLAVLQYPKALASVKSSAMEVEGFAGRRFTLCGTEGTFHIQPLDAPKALVALASPKGKYLRGYQEITFDKYSRYVGDAADLAKIVRGEKEQDFSYEHDYQVQKSVLLASAMPIDR